jgi:hypothetical protein
MSTMSTNARHNRIVSGQAPNYTFERTGCKSMTAHKKSREEPALFVLGEAPVPAFQLSR